MLTTRKPPPMPRKGWKKRQRGMVSVVALLVAIGVILAAAAAIAWRIHASGVDSGEKRKEDELRPQITRAHLERDQAQADRDTALEVNRRTMKAIDDLKQAHVHEMRTLRTALAELEMEKTKAEVELRKALVRVAQNEKRYTAEIRRLLEIAAGPAITEGACDEADAILRTLARDRSERLRVN